MTILGWDIGGVNTKVARVCDGKVVAARVEPFELQRAPDALPHLLAALARETGPEEPRAHAVTMTAELSQFFRTKREGVAFVLDAVDRALGARPVLVFAVDGRFLSPPAAREEPLAVAASNWAATAAFVARSHPDCLLVDIGSTTTDVIPVVAGRVAARGWTDPDRLATGELLYTGALRTPVEAIVQSVPVRARPTAVSAEAFALVGDVHLWRGTIEPEEYTVPTPDGRPATREFAGERLARVVCADREILDEDSITAIADAVAEAQLARVADCIARVRAFHALDTAVVTGLGAFIARSAAERAGMRVVSLADSLGDSASRAAPASAVALLLDAAIPRATPEIPVAPEAVPA